MATMPRSTRRAPNLWPLLLVVVLVLASCVVGHVTGIELGRSYTEVSAP